MESAEGIVRKLEGDKARVFIKRNTMCGDSCATCGLCGDKATVIGADNAVDAQVGDHVMVEIQTQSGLLGAFLAYGVPILIILLGMVMITITKANQLQGIVGVVVGIAVWFLLMWVMEKKGILKKKFGAKIVSIIEEEPGEED